MHVPISPRARAPTSYTCLDSSQKWAQIWKALSWEIVGIWWVPWILWWDMVPRWLWLLLLSCSCCNKHSDSWFLASLSTRCCGSILIPSPPVIRRDSTRTATKCLVFWWDHSSKREIAAIGGRRVCQPDLDLTTLRAWNSSTEFDWVATINDVSGDWLKNWNPGHA